MYINKINGRLVSKKELIEVVANDKDVDEIALIQKNIAKDSIKDKNGKSVFAVDDKKFIKSIISSKRGEILLYFNEDELVGFFELFCPDDSLELISEYKINEYNLDVDYKNMGVAESIVVLPKYRGNGLQVQMFKRMEQLAKERGITSLIGTVHPDNIYSFRNFDICGYKTLAKIEIHGGCRYLEYKKL